MRNRVAFRNGGRGRLRHAAILLLACVAATPGTAVAENGPNPLAGDYFVGASVFLFERTVLAAFAPAGSTDMTLDAGAVALAGEGADDESGSAAMEALVGWIDAWLGAKPTGTAGAVPEGFGAGRRRALACLIYGADPLTHGEVAQRAGLGGEDRKDCVARYQDAAKKWTAWLLPFRKLPGAPVPVRAAPEGAPFEGEPVLRLAFAPALDDADQAIADAMQKNGLFQVLTDGLNATLAMPRPMTALLTQCGEPKAFYNADRGEAVLCYELLAELLKAAP